IGTPSLFMMETEMPLRRQISALAGALALAALLAGHGARAQESNPPPPATPPTPNATPGLNPSLFFGQQRAATFGLGVGEIGNSGSLQLKSLVGFSGGPVGAGGALPFNILLPVPKPADVDKNPAYWGFLRSQDYPKPNTAENVAHYLQLVRYIRY